MIPPALAFQRFGIACLLGVGLGVLYGFLRPLRPRHTGLSDALFLLGAAWSWFGQVPAGLAAGLFASALTTLVMPFRDAEDVPAK